MALTGSCFPISGWEAVRLSEAALAKDLEHVKQVRSRAEKEKLRWLHRLLPERQDQNLALTVLYVPYSLDIGSLVP